MLWYIGLGLSGAKSGLTIVENSGHACRLTHGSDVHLYTVTTWNVNSVVVSNALAVTEIAEVLSGFGACDFRH
jgi:hypothetical protein